MPMVSPELTDSGPSTEAGHEESSECSDDAFETPGMPWEISVAARPTGGEHTVSWGIMDPDRSSGFKDDLSTIASSDDEGVQEPATPSSAPSRTTTERSAKSKGKQHKVLPNQSFANPSNAENGDGAGSGSRAKDPTSSSDRSAFSVVSHGSTQDIAVQTGEDIGPPCRQASEPAATESKHKGTRGQSEGDAGSWEWCMTKVSLAGAALLLLACWDEIDVSKMSQAARNAWEDCRGAREQATSIAKTVTSNGWSLASAAGRSGSRLVFAGFKQAARSIKKNQQKSWWGR